VCVKVRRRRVVGFSYIAQNMVYHTVGTECDSHSYYVKHEILRQARPSSDTTSNTELHTYMNVLIVL
jgi:hypothetical protein